MIEKLKRGDAVPYTQVSNALLTDKSLLLKEKGLLAYMLSKPDDWQFNVKSMSAELAENKDTIAAILKNLIEKRYITRTEIREHGVIKGYEYCVYQSPYPKTSDTVYAENTNTPYPKTPDPVSSDIPNKERQTKREGETDNVEPSRSREDAETKQTMSADALFTEMRERRLLVEESPLSLNQEEKQQAVDCAKKYTARRFLAWFQDAVKRKPGKPFRFLLEDFGHELKDYAVQERAPERRCKCGALINPDNHDDLCWACRVEAEKAENPEAWEPETCEYCGEEKPAGSLQDGLCFKCRVIEGRTRVSEREEVTVPDDLPELVVEQRYQRCGRHVSLGGEETEESGFAGYVPCGVDDANTDVVELHPPVHR